MIAAAWLVPALPFAAALAGLVLSQRARRSAASLAVTGTLLSTLAAVLLLARVLPDAARARETSALLAPFGPISVTVGTRSDGLAAVVAVMVCVVALLVQIYSIGYLADDPHYPRYAAEVSLFTAAMLLVVLSADLIALYAGWEVMGICSYLLIGHYRELPEAPDAAVKAFIVTRVGDVGFLLGVLLLGFTAGSFRIADVLGGIGHLGRPVLVAATLLLLAGVAGKSAQFPLHTWLPDAMAGPTPISALIHAATMVAAGAYVVARLYPLFAAAPVSLVVLGVVAAVTMLLGAFAALAQDDLKRVLAWSTVSQLAYITGGLAVGGVTAGMFHLLTHAAFKALLFLGAGVVLHTTGEQLMSRMGGLWRRLPLTFATMAIGSAALAGLPPLAGAFSKDSVLAAALESAHGNGPVPAWVGWLVYLAGLTTALITAAYVTRMLLLTFFGPVRGGAAVHRAPVVMTAPLVALAVPAALLGAVAGLIGTWMPALVPGTNTVHISVAALGLTTGLVIVGAGAAVARWRRARGTDPAQALGRALPVLRRGFLLDDVQDAVVVRPYRRFARAVLGIDSRIVDGAVRGCGVGARVTGGLLSRTQSGNVQSYVSGVVAASVVLALVAAIVLPFVVLA